MREFLRPRDGLSAALPAIAALLAACPPPAAVPALPSRGGHGWTELTSEHFTLWTDASPERGRALIQVMEELRQVIYGVSMFNPTVQARTFVVALANVDEVHAYVPPQFIAFSWDAHTPLFQPVIVLPIDHLDSDRRIVTHELTHAISYGAIADQPHWFAEGLASYFETIELDEHQQTIDVGVPSGVRVRELRTDRPLPVATLFACKQLSCIDERYYSTAWALFTYLMNRYPGELMTYMAHLAEGPPGIEDTAWGLAFPAELTPARLDHDLAQWIASGSVKVREYALKLQSWPVRQRALGDADALAARGLLRFLFDRDQVPPEIAQARAADPDEVLAALVQAMHDRTIAPDVAHRIAEAHADDWHVWWLVWLAVRTTGEEPEARSKLCDGAAKASVVMPIALCP